MMKVTSNLIQLNCLLAKYSRSHQNRDALHLFLQIHSSHHHKPDHYTLSTTLTACANLRHTAAGDQLHGYVIRAGFKAYPHIANTLLYLYAKTEFLVLVKRVFEEIENPDVYSWTTLLSACTKLGEVGYACEVFDEMCNRNEAVCGTTTRTRTANGTENREIISRNVAVWNAIVTGCAENGYEEIAFGLFKRMQLVGVRHDHYTFSSVLSLCCGEMLGFGMEVHSLVIKTGFFGRVSVVNALLTMYFNGGCVGDAYRVFEEVGDDVLDQITYNVMIAGLGSLGRDVEAFHMFKDMQELCLRPTELTFVSVMSSCSCARLATQVHAQAVKIGFEVYTSVSNATITMYSACGDLGAALMVFGELKEKDTVSWNTIITGYAQGNLCKAASLAYLQMQREGVEPDEYTIGSLLASTELLIDVEMIQAVVVKRLLFSNIQVSNALLCAFSKHGDMEQAYQVFRGMDHRNLISWNSLISGLQRNGFLVQGLKEFSELLMSKMSPNVYSFSIVLSICASISSLEHGKQIHGCILKCGYFLQASLGNALIMLYARCGDLNRSVKVFNMMNEKDNISWNSMISAYAQHGEGIKAVHCFDAMQDSSNNEPDKATFTSLLSACSHAGLIADGIRIFNSMVNIYGFEPEVDHFSCIVDLLGRAGYLDVAEKLITTKLIDINSNIWWTLFSSCAAHGNLRLGKIISEILLKNEEDDPTVYVLLSNIFANAGQWEEATNIRALMDTHRVVKQPGYSWINS